MENYFALVICLLLILISQCLPTTAGVVYYVNPTERPCAQNNSCPPNKICHIMDYFASNSTYYFSTNLTNVTLYFMCGIHNCTKHIDVRNLQSFAIIGTAGREKVTINMPITTEIPHDPKNIGNRTYIFTNVSNVRFENATINFISLSFEGNNCHLIAKHVDFRGYIGFLSPMVSVINITGSEATLNDCTFQNNCFIRIQLYAILTINDCIIHSYNHAVFSAVVVHNSTITLASSVSFINNTVGNDQYSVVVGGAISFNSGYTSTVPTYSAFNISAGARVFFLNNTAARCGGAIYMTFTVMSINSDSCMNFTGNRVAVVYNGLGTAGAMYIQQSQIIATKANLILFSENVAYMGGAMVLIESSFFISKCNKVLFVKNTALSEGGAVHIFNTSYITVDTYSKLMFYNNSAHQGGALHLEISGLVKVGSDSHIEFRYNSAITYGGAIYVDDKRCLFTFSNYSSMVLFEKNSANEHVGDHIYGASVKTCMNSFCYQDIVSYMPNTSLSPVSSPPKRVCLCDAEGKPKCAELNSIFFNLHKVYRGELFNVSVVLVGYDFGVTTGAINAAFFTSRVHSVASVHRSQYHQLVEHSTHCSNVTYSVYSNNIQETLSLYSSKVNNWYMFYSADVYGYVNDMIDDYDSAKHRCLDTHLFEIPVFINITLLDGCPPGFILTLQDQLHGCNCYPILRNNHFICFISNNIGYLKWNSTMWVNATFSQLNKTTSDGIVLARHCPLSYCRIDEKVINLGADPDAQCDFNRAGILCGGCRKKYSLAIGSSHCIRCSSDTPLLLFMFFAVAGFLLVVFILFFNLTVTQGLINGLLFYANILWTYKFILFPPKRQQIKLGFQIFIAWLNLDFGIETCFIAGLTAFWKTCLQFLFPLYLWLIAGTIIIMCRYSSHMTNLIGDRTVPLLATLFLLSYTKLLRTVISIFEFEVLTYYPDNSQVIVWYLDGNFQYCQHPHIYLFVIAMAILIFLCCPFTLFLFLIQFWRRMSHLRLLRWINKFTPFYDAYFAPLKDKHHYWFGTLLLIRGALLIVFTASSSTSPRVGLLALAITLIGLLLYTSINPLYKSKLVRIFESTSISNLLVLISCTLYTGDIHSGMTALQLSIGFAFVQFLLVILISVFKICYHTKYKCTRRKGYDLINEENSDMYHERLNDPDIVDIVYPVQDTVDSY